MLKLSRRVGGTFHITDRATGRQGVLAVLSNRPPAYSWEDLIGSMAIIRSDGWLAIQSGDRMVRFIGSARMDGRVDVTFDDTAHHFTIIRSELLLREPAV